MARDAGIIAAAPAPCSALAARSVGRFGAIAQNSDIVVKSPMPARNSVRRPRTSASRPAGASSAANSRA
ncbi:MAG TPA: hypothetical protein VGP70_05560 [Actinomadura sp.]|nr:hypothetical protein [Actinomadura sp.]